MLFAEALGKKLLGPRGIHFFRQSLDKINIAATSPQKNPLSGASILIT